MKLTADVRMRLCEDVNKSVAKLASDGTDGLNLNQFMRLLAIPPWSNVLPEDMKQQLHFSALKISAAAPTSPKSDADDYGTADNKAPIADQVLAKAMAIFDQVDEDSSGLIDQSELIVLVNKLSENLGGGDDLDSILDLQRFAKVAMDKFSEDGETLCFGELVQVLATKPWIRMLPENMRDDFCLLSQKERSEIREMCIRGSGNDRSVVKQVFTRIRKLFDAADTNSDGTLDGSELSYILPKLSAFCGKAFTSEEKIEMATSMVPDIERWSSAGDGKLSFSDFIKLVSNDPWKKVILLF